ncbi:hypothetical protein PITCH_A2030209 [uncultured Desulfobacterium sp.]|uniref:Uncharacterized protein n=1 Tax=uncultured Desulfobacterium sp. TaxID=201089 RepID=A0A445MX72_9BACT|nr:hypothetical protein PITCH_A2030209 [uncultured Desulfobacterium sp.]
MSPNFVDLWQIQKQLSCHLLTMATQYTDFPYLRRVCWIKGCKETAFSL